MPRRAPRDWFRRPRELFGTLCVLDGFRPTPTVPRRLRLRLEALEDRAVPAVISNGTVQLGVNGTANLIAADGSGGLVGLKYLPTDNESLAIAYMGEGWGIADYTGTRS